VADWIQGVIESLGYFGVGLLVFLENVVPPIPSEVVLPLAGYVAAEGPLALLGVIVASTIGSTAGALPVYYAGRRLGRGRVRRAAERHGCWLGVSPEDIDRADGWFKRHRGSAVFVGRLVPGLRSVISLPAGIAGMEMWRFVVYTAAGATLWNGALTGAGYLLVHRFTVVEEHLNVVTNVVIGAMVVAYVTRVVRYRRAQAAC
jgi:membrane protein DedA with SNARE-associated domain